MDGNFSDLFFRLFGYFRLFRHFPAFHWRLIRWPEQLRKFTINKFMSDD